MKDSAYLSTNKLLRKEHAIELFFFFMMCSNSNIAGRFFVSWNITIKVDIRTENDRIGALGAHVAYFRGGIVHVVPPLLVANHTQSAEEGGGLPPVSKMLRLQRRLFRGEVGTRSWERLIGGTVRPAWSAEFWWYSSISVCPHKDMLVNFFSRTSFFSFWVVLNESR
jgi:hypothetical protein